jgi:hypothetical protein
MPSSGKHTCESRVRLLRRGGRPLATADARLTRQCLRCHVLPDGLRCHAMQEGTMDLSVAFVQGSFGKRKTISPPGGLQRCRQVAASAHVESPSMATPFTEITMQREEGTDHERKAENATKRCTRWRLVRVSHSTEAVSADKRLEMMRSVGMIR